MCKLGGRDHNATSYSTETRNGVIDPGLDLSGRDHNATSYSTETAQALLLTIPTDRRDHNATSYSTETMPRRCRVGCPDWQRS